MFLHRDTLPQSAPAEGAATGTWGGGRHVQRLSSVADLDLPRVASLQARGGGITALSVAYALNPEKPGS